MSAAAPLGGSVDEWLDWQSTLHASEIELGLARVAEVARRLNLLPLAGRSVVIAGTNGKGSCAALIESLLTGKGRVGTYTSPHLWRYNERIRIDGTPVADADLRGAFVAVEQARGSTPLTYFEYGTLAALWLFAAYEVDFAVLEVGLGGRLDAVNIVDADVALITNIGLDHVDWLGPDRDSIGFEKAGVMRTGRPAICADRDMPATIGAQAAALAAPLWRIGHDFELEADAGTWHWRHAVRRLETPVNDSVLADNLAGAIAVYEALFDTLPTAENTARACRAQAALPGRRERVDGMLPIIYDVGHNGEAVAVLARYLADHPVSGKTHLVLGMLADKPVETVGGILDDVGDQFYLAGLDGISPRGLSSGELAARLGREREARMFEDPKRAQQAALTAGVAGDRVVVCGSFLTVAHAREQCPS
ncbi:bifunctional tetrahydrofolate synthase/dihydrofolate synthase [Salinisphaera aquimarina]|uniref:Dihydrofolate synthase/folylpolyglutamate synthase n=1 Tax=Salinisphaera aquimarina TaxID=2094031 RepID=A0ABV7EUU1_9GAMM